MATLVGPMKFKVFLDSGAPAAGGKVYTYQPSTSTPKATYTSAAQTTSNANPVILDSRGEADIWFSGPYRLVFTDSSDVEIDDIATYQPQPFVTTVSINDPNDNEVLKLTGSTTPVSNLKLTNATTGNAPSVTATLTSTAVDFSSKGTGAVIFADDANITGNITVNGNIINSSGATVAVLAATATADTFLDLSSTVNMLADNGADFAVSGNGISFTGGVILNSAPTFSENYFIKNTVKLNNSDDTFTLTLGLADALAANRTITLPSGTPSAGDIVTVDGSGVLSYTTATAPDATTSTEGIALLATSADVLAETEDDEFVATGDLASTDMEPIIYLHYNQTGPTIGHSKNVMSVTDNSAGNFTVNYAITLDDWVIHASCFFACDILGGSYGPLDDHKCLSMGTTSANFITNPGTPADFERNNIVIWGTEA